MKTIWKYELTGRETAISMPKGAEFLSMGVQGKHICLWFLIPDDHANVEQRVFELFGTGHTIPSFAKMVYRGTLVDNTMDEVWHVFEVVV